MARTGKTQGIRFRISPPKKASPRARGRPKSAAAVGIVGGVLLNFGWNVAIFSIPLVLSFKGAPFLPVDIYFSTRYGIRWSYAATLSAVLFFITFGLSYLYMLLARPTRTFSTGGDE